MEIGYMNGELVFVDREQNWDGYTRPSPGAVHVVKCSDLARLFRRILRAAGATPGCGSTQKALWTIIYSLNLTCRHGDPSYTVPVAVVDGDALQWDNPGVAKKRLPSIRSVKGRRPAGMTVHRGGLYSPTAQAGAEVLGREFKAWRDNRRGDRREGQDGEGAPGGE